MDREWEAEAEEVVIREEEDQEQTLTWRLGLPRRMRGGGCRAKCEPAAVFTEQRE